MAIVLVSGYAALSCPWITWRMGRARDGGICSVGDVGEGGTRVRRIGGVEVGEMWEMGRECGARNLAAKSFFILT